MTDSPSRGRYRPPVPISTPSPREKSSRLLNIKTIGYKRLINTIMNIELEKHIDKIGRLTSLFKYYDDDNDGVITQQSLFELLGSCKITIDYYVEDMIREYTREPKLRKNESVLNKVKNEDSISQRQIVYTAYIDMAKKKIFSNKSLMDILKE